MKVDMLISAYNNKTPLILLSLLGVLMLVVGIISFYYQKNIEKFPLDSQTPDEAIKIETVEKNPSQNIEIGETIPPVSQFTIENLPPRETNSNTKDYSSVFPIKTDAYTLLFDSQNSTIYVGVKDPAVPTIEQAQNTYWQTIVESFEEKDIDYSELNISWRLIN